MKNKLILFGLLFSIFNIISAQNAYFQQEVNYKIAVRLDDTDHSLSGNIEMEYINHSPDKLEVIYMHLWPNAYKNRTTAFCRQQLNHGGTRFYFADEKDLGYLDSLNFLIDNEKTNWSYDAEDPDIAIIPLKTPLETGASIKLSTPFKLKIPASFSRLGHVEQSYQMTQWYPKPAVYDQEGWHPMPYLDMGEFYAEFGSFDVTITLPENYVVAATGVLQSQEEKEFLEKRIALTNENMESGFRKENDFPLSSKTFKTIRYTAEQVHDFAWFADKRFHVQKSQVEMASGKTVETWAFFTNEEANLWKEATDYLDRSVLFYSELVGEYPYPHATAVQSALSAGGGMEYPMITVIGLSGDAKSLDGVITHEVGHNWFYGILAFNERDSPWMDEGINSYYDHRYTEKYYGSSDYQYLPEFITQGTDLKLSQAAYLFQARRRLDQAPQTSSDELTPINYFISAYEKPAASLKLLEKYVGTEKFDEIMQAFYDEWKFKHPSPEALQKHWEKSSTQNISWFFEGLMESNQKVDYAIKSVKRTKAPSGEGELVVTVKNKNGVAVPFTLSGIRKGEAVATEQFDGHEGSRSFVFPSGNYDHLEIDAENLLWDMNRSNNISQIKGPFKHLKRPRLRLAAGLENSNNMDFFAAPVIGWNEYDKIMLGLSVYNRTLIAKTLEFGFQPMYSFVSDDLNGVWEVRVNAYPKNSWLRKITFGASGRAFNYDRNTIDDYFLQYYRITPYVDFALSKTPKSRIFQNIRLKTILTNRQVATFISSGEMEGTFAGKEDIKNEIFQAQYTLEKRTALNPASLKFTTEFQQTEIPLTEISYDYVKLSLEYIQNYTFQRKRNITIRFFAGTMLTSLNDPLRSNSNLIESLALTSQGFNDYAYEGYFFGRSDQTGIWSRQVSIREGGFKNAFGSTQRNNIGQSSEYLFAVNIKSTLPFKKVPGLLKPVKPYFDMAYYSPTRNAISDQFIWSGGLMLEYGNGILGIYFPLINSEAIRDTYRSNDGNQYGPRITFSLDLQRLHPWDLIDKVEF